MDFRGNRGDTQEQPYDNERGRPLSMLVRRATGRYKETKFYRVSKGVGVAHSTVGISRTAQPWEREGDTFIVFLKKGRKEIAVEAGNSRVVRELQRKLYRKAKQELRKPLEEDDRKAVFGKTERTV
jgi:hypothetical protein